MEWRIDAITSFPCVVFNKAYAILTKNLNLLSVCSFLNFVALHVSTDRDF